MIKALKSFTTIIGTLVILGTLAIIIYNSFTSNSISRSVPDDYDDFDDFIDPDID